MSAAALATDAEAVSFDRMQVPIRKLLREAGMTAYDLANAFEARGLSGMAAYRIVANDGKQARYDAKVINALADIFEIGPDEASRLIILPKRKS